MRTIVISRDNVALAEPLDGERERIIAEDHGPFDPDPDDRPPLQQVVAHRLTVIDPADGEPLGMVSWHAEGYGPSPNCAAWNIGIGLLPHARGRGVGTLAQRLL